MDNGSVQGRVDAVTALSPPEETTVGGQPAQVVRAADYMDADLRFWLAAWELPDGTLCAVQTPDDFTRDDVLAIAEGVRYEP
ncbi:MAG: hypothetical protein JHC71_00825 [Blastococcus sp.]|nr:hypothetical protein [Blastococcus sp.]